jgi:hypothetical protein
MRWNPKKDFFLKSQAWWYTPVTSYSGGRGRRISSSRLGEAKLARSYLKNEIETGRLRDGVHEVNHLSSMCEALGSIPGITHANTYTHKPLV